jgi:hypothetical protein
VAGKISFLAMQRQKMTINAYWAYGIRIHAEIVCPELLPHPQPIGNPDVTIRLLPPVDRVAENLENGYFEVRPGLFRLAVPGVAQYLVEEGTRISVEPVEGAAPEEVRLFLLGSTMGALLYQRGLFPLHGSAVETSRGAMIFVGEQGVGKSTLAAQFHHKGYRLLSDDVCAVTMGPEGLRVLPALAQFRLCADAYERLGTPETGRFNVDKFVVPMGEGYCTEPAPLKAIHILGVHENEAPHFEVLRGFDRVQRLLENLYRPQYLKGQSTQSDLMRMAGQIAQQTTIAEVTRRRDTEAIDGMIAFLESSWAKHFAVDLAKEK